MQRTRVSAPRHWSSGRGCETVAMCVQLRTLSHVNAKPGRERLLRMARHREIVTAVDAVEAGIHPQELPHALPEGLIHLTALGPIHLSRRPRHRKPPTLPTAPP